MALLTFGSAATTTLAALQFIAGISPTDHAALNTSIKKDSHNPGQPLGPQPIILGAFDRAGLLVIPDRGVLRVVTGDYVAVDATGWPILISARAAASASWVHT
jgi:hypothetical protein